ncbi:S-linalool synthase-like [Curcuma longa]|uniref:S-linalool synthase-like n=1 Tax=Curcuma longa TaxID=136217 RepID=UPI003D9E5BB6
MVAKCATLVTIADDFFDEKGTESELETLTEVVNRWEGNDLCSHSNVIFDALHELVNEVEFNAFREHDIGSYQNFQRELEDGKFNMVPLYMKENLESNIEDSVGHIKTILERKGKEFLELFLNQEYGRVPRVWKELHLVTLKAFWMEAQSLGHQCL